MGKISLVSVKYTIFAKIIAEGTVEKPDVIGAIFGQTEGLLGDELELRELQKNGKIGRINVELSTKDGRTEGMIEIPTSLDKAETTIIAATLETIERIGPCEAKITIDKIEDVRVNKREYVVERAKKLLEVLSSSAPDSREIETEVATSARKARIQEYGEEKLPAGPDMENPEIIVVEGRADVLNLLRDGIKNSIAMNGTSLPKTIKELAGTKSITLFIDGDRGGFLIAKDVVANCNVDFIAQAPAGKEVEELVSKEIISSLRNRKNTEQFFESLNQMAKDDKKKSKELSEYERGEFQKILYELAGTRNACLVDEDLKILSKMPISELSGMHYLDKVYAIIMDGTATNGIAKIAEKAKCKYLIARNFAITLKTRINLISV